jgi:DNA-binding NarL/FixJ family response regulator
MCLPITFRGNHVQALTLTRTSGVFTDRQRALLAPCGPHVRAAMDRGLLAGGTGLRLSEQPGWVPLEKAPSLRPPVTPLSRAPDDPGVPAVPARAISAREREVLTYVARGLTDAQIASRLGVRPATVSKHLHRIYHRHGLANRAAATRLLAGQPRLSDA